VRIVFAKVLQGLSGGKYRDVSRGSALLVQCLYLHVFIFTVISLELELSVAVFFRSFVFPRSVSSSSSVNNSS
jgi:hypothetical protein